MENPSYPGEPGGVTLYTIVLAGLSLCLVKAVTPKLGLWEGTLLVVIPARDGIIIAGDSRASQKGYFQDDRTKIRIVSQNNHIAFGVTGKAEFQMDANRSFVIADFVSAYLGGAEHRSLSGPVMEGLFEYLRSNIKQILNDGIGSFGSLIGKQSLMVVIVSFDPATHQSTIAKMQLGVGDKGTPELWFWKILRVFPNCKAGAVVDVEGEKGYFMDHVWKKDSFGHKHLTSDTIAFLTGASLVSDADGAIAATVAINMIKAASITSEAIPVQSGSGIGGPVKVLFVDGVNIPFDPLEK